MRLDRLTISTFSSLTKLSRKALLHYEQKGLLEPMSRDPMNNYRYYSLSQLEVAVKIKLLATMGFGTDEIKDIIKAAEVGDEAHLQQLFARRRSEIQLEISRLQKLEEIISTRHPLELLYMKCTEPLIKDLPAMRVLSKRKKGNYSRDMPGLIGDLMKILYHPENQKRGVSINGPIMLLTRDTEYKEEGADIEVAVPFSGRITTDEGVEVRSLPSTRVASLIYTGAYREIHVGYTRLQEFVLKEGHGVRAPVREVYLNSPSDVSEEELLTEIQIPLEVA